VPDDADIDARAAALEACVDEPPKLPIDPPLPAELSLLGESALGPRGRERVTGIVDRFFGDKGYGFLRYGEGETLFFHVTQVGDIESHIEPGTAVSFIIGHNPKKGKPQAEDVRRAQ
jgi:cold shock CspA family protein